MTVFSIENVYYFKKDFNLVCLEELLVANMLDHDM